MVRDRRTRTKFDLKRKGGKRPTFDRILIVCEGERTEVNYFEEIRQDARLPTVDVRVIKSDIGTEPKQVVESAEQEFAKSKRFERVYVVFDRDEHKTYADAISRAEKLARIMHRR